MSSGGEEVFVTIGEVAGEPVLQDGPSGEFTYVDIGSIDRDRKRIVDAKVLPRSEAPSRARQMLKAGDVLVSMTRPNLNAVALVPESLDGAVGSTGFHVLRSRWIKPEYLFHLAQSQDFIEELCAVVQGALYPAVRPKDIDAFSFKLPPRAEQTRIVEKLEELLGDLDAGVAELKAAQKKLVRYRQSLLKAAVEGRLTADWRARNPSTESGADLLARILRERRARWEARQLAKFQAQGKPPPKNWQAKYPEPVAPDTTDLPALPQGWTWASLDALIQSGPQNGLYLPGERYGSGTPILRIDDFQVGWHRDKSDLRCVDADALLCETYAVFTNDLLINRVNSLTHLGKSLLVKKQLAGVLFESNMMRLSLSENVSCQFISLYLGSEVGRTRMIKNAKWAVNQASINQQDVGRTPIPLAPYDEQARISSVVHEMLETQQYLEREIALVFKQSTAQRQNLLKAAFSGQLVPQHPADEPASALLARIRAERAALTEGSKPRGRKKKASA